METVYTTERLLFGKLGIDTWGGGANIHVQPSMKDKNLLDPLARATRIVPVDRLSNLTSSWHGDCDVHF